MSWLCQHRARGQAGQQGLTAGRHVGLKLGPGGVLSVRLGEGHVTRSAFQCREMVALHLRLQLPAAAAPPCSACSVEQRPDASRSYVIQPLGTDPWAMALTPLLPYCRAAAGGMQSLKDSLWAVNAWYDEVCSYDFSRPGFSMETGHYTAVG